ncbi:MAG: ribosome silencing factor [Oscillospiraceae bacterium]|nr:ribosome silencing factor [Oscillospiraceae bacterium]
MQPIEIAKMAARVLDDKKATGIRVLEVTDITVLADYFILCTATSSTHLKTLTDEVQFRLKGGGVTPHHVEGHMSGNWILIDFGSVVIHLFLQETRDFYDLERLWRDAKEIDGFIDDGKD